MVFSAGAMGQVDQSAVQNNTVINRQNIELMIPPDWALHPNQTLNLTNETIPVPALISRPEMQEYLRSQLIELGVVNYTANLNATYATTTTSTTGTTTTTVCGRTTRYCGVDLDSTGDGISDCCTAENNPSCAACLEDCIAKCSGKGRGLLSCFKEAGVVSCDCGSEQSVCHPLPTTTIEAQKTVVVGSNSPGVGNTMIYVLTVVVLFAGTLGAIYFVNRFR